MFSRSFPFLRWCFVFLLSLSLFLSHYGTTLSLLTLLFWLLSIWSQCPRSRVWTRARVSVDVCVCIHVILFNIFTSFIFHFRYEKHEPALSMHIFSQIKTHHHGVVNVNSIKNTLKRPLLSTFNEQNKCVQCKSFFRMPSYLPNRLQNPVFLMDTS